MATRPANGRDNGIPSSRLHDTNHHTAPPTVNRRWPVGLTSTCVSVYLPEWLSEV
jgi:hypothetical protein